MFEFCLILCRTLHKCYENTRWMVVDELLVMTSGWCIEPVKNSIGEVCKAFLRKTVVIMLRLRKIENCRRGTRNTKNFKRNCAGRVREAWVQERFWHIDGAAQNQSARKEAYSTEDYACMTWKIFGGRDNLLQRYRKVCSCLMKKVMRVHGMTIKITSKRWIPLKWAINVKSDEGRENGSSSVRCVMSAKKGRRLRSKVVVCELWTIRVGGVRRLGTRAAEVGDERWQQGEDGG